MIRRSPISSPPLMSKPRASGDDPDMYIRAEYGTSVNPARAGMIHVPGATDSALNSKPRASGDDPHEGDFSEGVYV